MLSAWFRLRIEKEAQFIATSEEEPAVKHPADKSPSGKCAALKNSEACHLDSLCCTRNMQRRGADESGPITFDDWEWRHP
jgi:hypothetical protein